jgi:hypothetical protein
LSDLNSISHGKSVKFYPYRNNFKNKASKESKMKIKTILSISLTFLICCLALSAGCAISKDDKAQTETSDDIVPTDYSQSAHWLNIPTEATKEVPLPGQVA